MSLGHCHSTATYADQDGPVRMTYAGTHETTKFGERDSGNAVIVEIADPGAAPTVTPVRTGGLFWVTMEEELRECGDLSRLRVRIESIEGPGSTLLDVR